MDNQLKIKIIYGIICSLLLTGWVITPVSGEPTCGNFPNVTIPQNAGVIGYLAYSAGGTLLPTGDRAYFNATFTNIPTGNDIQNNNPYADWCVDAVTHVTPNSYNVVYQFYSVNYSINAVQNASLVINHSYVQNVR